MLALIGNIEAEDIGTSVVVLGEIRRGNELKRRNDTIQAQAMDLWFDRMRSGLGDRVTPIDEAIADQCVRLNIPDPLPSIDGLLAATAIVRSLVLTTRNTVDVERTGILLLNPFEG